MMWNRKGQAGFVSSFFQVVPKPLLFVIFVLLLVGIGFLLNPVFNSFGVFCTTDEEVVRVSNGDLFTNLNLIFTLPSIDDIKGDSRDPNGFLEKCTEWVNGSERFLNYGCSNCSLIEGFTSTVDTRADVCVGDAYRKSDDDLNWYQRNIACVISDCLIPDGYFYSVDSGLYECEGIGCEDAKVGAERDARLKKLGAIPYYSEDTLDTDYQNFARFTCNNKLQVQPTIFGIPVFNPALWMILMLIVIMLYAVINFRKK